MGRIFAAVATAAITIMTSPEAMKKIKDMFDPNKGKGGKRR